MRKLKTALRAGAAAVVAVGFAGAAFAQRPQTHVMTLMLPSGGAAHIRYTGDVAPQVTFSDTPAPLPAATPSLFGTASPFAEMARISALMDRQAAALLREAAAISAQPGVVDTSFGNLPAGAGEYTFVSTMSGNGVCSRSVEFTSLGNGAPPKIVRRASGDCGTATTDGFRLPTQQQVVPAPDNRPNMIMTKAIGAEPYASRVQEAAVR